MRSFFLLMLFLVVSCKPVQKEFTAQEIVDTSIINSGFDKLKKSEIQFNFRNQIYFAKRYNGNFYLGTIKDSIVDVLSNDGFKRLVHEKAVLLPDSIANKYANAVNSVHYFSVLPYGLNDNAVHKKLLNSSTIKGKEYYKIEVTFSENGGGEDYKDVFIYWIDKKDFLLDYVAYSYHTNGGGKRFRAIKNEQRVNGLRFVNYENYKPINTTTSLKDLDKEFERNKLKKVSEIILKEISVNTK